MGRVTLQTIADEVGVSRMTVSNAFSRPDQLSDDLRTKILAKASELGYTGPDPTARSLARGKAGSVGILLTDTVAHAFDDEITAVLVGAIAAELAPTGSALTLLTSADDGEYVPARDVALDGALVYSCSEESTAIAWLIKRQLPVVFIDQYPRDGYDSINIDDRGGARLAAQHVIDLGHRRIAVATASYGTRPVDDPFETGNPVSEQRLLGWFDAIRGAGLDAPVFEAGKDEVSARVAATALLDLEPRPTAVVCISDVVAAGVVRVAQERGLRVPDDLSVVGFDGSQLAALMQPVLTTVRQDVVRKGREAAAALVDRMTGGTDDPRRVRLPVELIVGGSTAAPPS